MSKYHRVLIVGGGARGIATASSLKKRDGSRDIAIVEPALLSARMDHGGRRQLKQSKP